ncbi:MAG: aminotransferase [Coriobacteriaceae bacterium]|jgi:aspartate/methionine/tyrosine aminotransferase|nr:aminotransferase [Coriobacteriaceae bacterium]
MYIRDFGVEMWMNEYENDCEINLAETCVKPFTVREIMEMTDNPQATWESLLDIQLTYGAIEGSELLRGELAKLYESAQPANIVTTHGAIGANNLVINSIVNPGDRVVSVLPTYQQLYSIPESLGAEVRICPLLPENGFLPDLDEMRSYVNENTSLICINNPNNPTGALMGRAFLEQVVEIARTCGAYVLCDEAYRGLNHTEYGENFAPGMFDLYEKGISTGSFSKAFSLAGLRLGWIAAPRDLIEAVNRHRDYNTISCGLIDDRLAAIALQNKEALLRRSLKIIADNAAVLDAWVAEEPHISYVKPQAGTTAFLKYDLAIDSKTFCSRLQHETGVMLLPGAVMDREGWLRIGYCFAEDTSELEEGLSRVSAFMEKLAQE